MIGAGQEDDQMSSSSESNPSELVYPLFEQYPDLGRIVLEHMNPTDNAMFSQVCQLLHSRVAEAAVPIAGKHPDEALYLTAVYLTKDVAHLQWAVSNGIPLVAHVFAIIAASGNLDMLVHARALGFEWDASVCQAAAAKGHTHILKWLRGSFQHTPCPFLELTGRDCCAVAALGGHLGTLKWLRKHGCPWDRGTCNYAAKSGNLRVLKYARRHGCDWGARTTANAANSGNLEMLQWMRAENPRCPWNGDTMRFAAFRGHIDILRWALANGCPWQWNVFMSCNAR